MFIFEMTSGRPSLSLAQQWRGGAEFDPSAADVTLSGFVAFSPPAKQRFKAPVGWHHAVWPRRAVLRLYALASVHLLGLSGFGQNVALSCSQQAMHTSALNNFHPQTYDLFSLSIESMPRVPFTLPFVSLSLLLVSEGSERLRVSWSSQTSTCLPKDLNLTSSGLSPSFAYRRDRTIEAPVN